MKRHSMILSVGIAIMTLSQTAMSAQIGYNIAYGPEKEYRGYFVPAKKGSGESSGIVMIHEFWGLNDNIKSEADRYGSMGYNVLAVDLFNKVASTPEEARALVQGLDQQAALAEMLAAANYLRSLPRSDGQVGSLGWCFGGGQSLILALNDPKLVTAVIYYGQPVTDMERLKNIKAHILGHFGETDRSISMAKVREFDQTLTAAEVSHRVYTYSGAPHAFANPTNTNAFRPDAAKKANRRTADFLKKYLK